MLLSIQFARGFALVAAVALHSATAPGQAPQWTQYQADSSHAGYAPVTLDPLALELRFEKQPPTDRELGHPIAADGVILAQRRRAPGTGLYAYDHISGELLWSEDFATFGAQLISDPAWVQGAVMVEALKGSYTSEFRTFDTRLGVPYATGYGLHSFSSYGCKAPSVYGNVAYLASGRYDGVAAREIATGDLIWNYDSVELENDWTPAVDDDYVYLYLEGKLHAYDRVTGAIEYNVPDPDWTGGRHDYSTPRLGSLDNVIVGHSNRIMSWDRNTGLQNWAVSGNWRDPSAVAHGIIFARGYSGQVVALSELDGSFLWEWFPPNSDEIEWDILVTDSHFVCSSYTDTYIVDLGTRNLDWQYSNGGKLCLAESNLVIAGTYGILSVFAYREVPEPAAISPARMEYYVSTRPTVTVTGEGFTEPSEIEVWFGDEKADQVVVIDDQTLSCRPPDRGPGVVDVTVRNSHGYGTIADGFAYTPSQQLGGSFGLGEQVNLSLQFEEGHGIAVLFDFGARRSQKTQVPPYIGDFWLESYQILFEVGSWPFGERLDLDFQIPMNLALVGMEVQVQSAIGPNPRGKQAAFSNLVSFQIQ